MKTTFLLLIAFCFITGSYTFGQSRSENYRDWQALSSTNHQQGTWLVGAGPTVFGATAKIGHFINDRFWLGVEAEVHQLNSDRREAGLFGRYYLWSGRLSGFTELGVSYGRFQKWDYDIIDKVNTNPIYNTAKLNGALGIEYTLGRRIAVEAVGKAGKLINTDWIQPSFQLSLNVYLGR